MKRTLAFFVTFALCFSLACTPALASCSHSWTSWERTSSEEGSSQFIICALIVLLLLCPQALAIEATPAPWEVYQSLETGAEQVEVLVDYTRYEEVRLCVINVDEGSFLKAL